MHFLQNRQTFSFAALILAVSAFLSRLMGLVRDKIVSWQFGASGEADMYFAAFVVPDIINYLLAGSFMSITIIPLLARRFQDDTDGWNLFSCIFIWMFIASALFAILGEIFADKLAYIIAPGFSPAQLARLTFFMRIILPAQIFFLSGSAFTALLLLRRQFAVPGLTPLIYNGFIILCGLFLPYLTDIPQNFGMTGFCIGVTLGAFLGAFCLPVYTAWQGKIHLHLQFYHPWLKKFLIIALPLMLGQTVVMLDEQFLRIFGSMLPEGSISLLNYSRRVAQVPVALMGQAIAVASYPFLVKLLAQNEYDKFNQSLHKALATGLGLIIPCALFMLAASQSILALIFQGGSFGVTETLACVPLTQILLAGTPFWILYMVLARAYYAYEDTLTPVITGTLMSIICVPVYYFFAVPAGAFAIAITSALSVAIYSLWLTAIWIKRKGNTPFKTLPVFCAKILAISLLSASITALAATQIKLPLNFWSACIKLSLEISCFGICFCLFSRLFFPEYLNSLKNIVIKRFKKSKS